MVVGFGRVNTKHVLCIIVYFWLRSPFHLKISFTPAFGEKHTFLFVWYSVRTCFEAKKERIF